MAYLNWCGRGKPAHDDWTDWFHAEELLKQEIREAAYFHWINRGQPLWDPWADWLSAESLHLGLPWGPLIDSEICAIHAAVVPTMNGDGEVIYFGGDQYSRYASLHKLTDNSRRFNCRTEAISKVLSPQADLFCCGHGFMADGRLLVGGGTVKFPKDSPNHPANHHDMGHFSAERRCWVYDPLTHGFAKISSFGPEPGHELANTGGGRWYPSILTLSNGEMLAVGGHPAGDDSRHLNDTPERYSAATDTWTRLPKLPGVGTDLSYVRMHVIQPDGFVLVSWTSDDRTIKYNPWTGDSTVVTTGPRVLAISSVILPLIPEDRYNTCILITGGKQPKKLDLGADNPSWQDAGMRSGSAAGKERFNSNAVLLPTGKVLVVGGLQNSDHDATGVQTAELYNPENDEWVTIEDRAQQVRNYHSTMLLLPDGRVWTAGSNVDSLETDEPGGQAVTNIEIFSPPYPLGIRPTISQCPSRVDYGTQFTVESPQAYAIRRVALLRCGSMTHAMDLDQRYVGLTITRQTETILTVVAPPNGATAPPGYYMLFIIDAAGRPCQYARFIRLE